MGILLAVHKEDGKSVMTGCEVIESWPSATAYIITAVVSSRVYNKRPWSEDAHGILLHMEF